jgi:endonuclease IV
MIRSMLRIGAHMSVAGGVSKAVDRAALHGCEALQIFTKNANRWQSKPLDRRRFGDSDASTRPELRRWSLTRAT